MVPGCGLGSEPARGCAASERGRGAKTALALASAALPRGYASPPSDRGRGAKAAFALLWLSYDGTSPALAAERDRLGGRRQSISFGLGAPKNPLAGRPLPSYEGLFWL